eukprot:CAMPEP_0113938510 /NCGR_PEP_ID=MMETSP1339-20121228/4943_1 /TAXON_ID=94617 /ORGANISM="Fibrocapsa japonica" /LENGTH=302 /DNA_ID=CAMNT_0000941665 /DNA_START=132 /DNA_END=1040 /DNA_ORIENTATION=+ /assembly_acc=CAM_ASM_000762
MAGHERELFFKCELFQKAGSFKPRGALNAVILAENDADEKGRKLQNVITQSSGNMGQAVAWVCQNRGLTAHVVMPNDSAQCKMDAVAGYGANIILCEPTIEARNKATEKAQEELGAKYVHPHQDPHVVCGQGTVGLELVEQVREMTGGMDMDAVLVPVGGGGLCSGVAVAVKAMSPGTKVIGVEPEMASSAKPSREAGNLISMNSLPNTLADGLRVSVGPITWPIMRDVVDDVVTVSEAQIQDTLKLVVSRMKLAIEPSAAVALAAALYSEDIKKKEGLHRIGVILCGGNVDMSRLSNLLSS